MELPRAGASHTVSLCSGNGRFLENCSVQTRLSREGKDGLGFPPPLFLRIPGGEEQPLPAQRVSRGHQLRERVAVLTTSHAPSMTLNVFSIVFFNPHPRTCILICREREREGEREREKHGCGRNIDQLPLVHALTRDRAGNLGMCPDRE